MARDSVANHGLQLVEGIGFRENRKTKGARLIATFRGLLNGKDDLALRHVFLTLDDYTLPGKELHCLRVEEGKSREFKVQSSRLKVKSSEKRLAKGSPTLLQKAQKSGPPGRSSRIEGPPPAHENQTRHVILIS